MKILTNNKRYSQKLFPASSGYEVMFLKTSQQEMYPLLQDIFQQQPVYQTSVSEQLFWKYALITQHAPSSQFQTLINSIQKNDNLTGGIFCLADSGQGFTGYRDRTWTSVKGNLHLSVFLKPDQPIDHFETGFTILSAVSAVQAINEIKKIKETSQIRWINDVVIGNAKVGGVLTHTFSQGNVVTGAVLGIGINVETTPEIDKDIFVPKATSLSVYITQPYENLISLLLLNLLDHLAVNYKLLLNNRYDDLLDIYRTHSTIIGKICGVYSDPITGNPEKLHQGKIIKIGKNLELYFKNQQKAIKGGRITII